MKEIINKKEGILIGIKLSEIEQWKPEMKISDFFVEESLLRYNINKIISQSIPRGNDREAKIVFSYFDRKNNFESEKTLFFKFKKSQNESLAQIITDHDFVLNENLLKTHQFKEISIRNVASTNPNIKIIDMQIMDWSIFNNTISLKLTLDLLGVKKIHILKKELQVEFHELIFKLIRTIPNENFVFLNNDFEFEVKKLSLNLINYKNFFHESDEARLLSIVENVQIINPKIAIESIDISNNQAIGEFSSTIKIESMTLHNFIFITKYDATIMKETIGKIIAEIPFKNNILGFPKKTKIELKDIFLNWNQLKINKIWQKRGFHNVISKNTIIEASNFNLEKNSIEIKVLLKDNDNLIPLKSSVLTFEKTLFKSLDQEIRHHNFIAYVNPNILDGYPLYSLTVLDFETIANDQFKLTAVENIGAESIQADWTEYEFTFLYNDDVDFKYLYKIQFAQSKIEYLFSKLSYKDFDISNITSKPNSYFYEKIDNFNLNWITIDVEDLKAIKMSSENKKTDFVIKKAYFKKFSINKEFQTELSLEIFSQKLNQDKTILIKFHVNNSHSLNKFESLNGDDIELVQPNILNSYPIPLLDVIDFKIKKPFEIESLSAKYNEINSSVFCLFHVNYLNESRIVQKELFFGYSSSVKNSDILLEEFKNLTAEDIVVKYDPSISDYHINPQVKLIPKNELFFVKLINWKVLNKKGNIKIYVEVHFQKEVRIVSKNIIFNTKLTKSQFKEWKVANYA